MASHFPMCEEAGHPPSTHICVDDDEMSSYISADADRCVAAFGWLLESSIFQMQRISSFLVLHVVDSESECPTSPVRQGQ